ncbi:MAG TPA: hypothetical protein VLJ18_12050 [Thermoanaerobaculia bacterium]|nr:hypothetical protein [Thermoanaerobaculia bacterium]
MGQLLVVMTCGAAFYGAVLGFWRAPIQALYAAMKLPLVMVVTSCLTMVFNWMLATLMGTRMTLGQVTALTFLALATASLVLASLAPVALIFTLSAPEPSTDARTAHNLLYLFHTLFIAGAGLAGTARVKGPLDRICRDPARSRKIHYAWILTFAFVGGEVAWALRPFVGSVFFPVVFLRGDAFHGNMYEFIFSDILPHLLRWN